MKIKRKASKTKSSKRHVVLTDRELANVHGGKAAKKATKKATKRLL
jgi:hypothetical protein